MNPRPIVVKIGGRALESPGAIRELASELAARLNGVVMVHGGGAEVGAWCDRLGIPARVVDGLRATDAATLEVVAAVLAGLANKRLVASLRAAGLDAVGLSAVDGGMAKVAPHPRAAELGRVGEVESVDPTLMHTLLAAGRVPVLASLAAAGETLLNVNADDFAAAIATSLGASDLILLSDAPGVVMTGSVVPRLDAAGLAAAIEHPEVTGGMLVKLQASARAVAAGVDRVHVAAWMGAGTLPRLLAGESAGTTILTGMQPSHV